ncbi:aminotransferase class IV [Staphylococcus agnetis]|uniref:Aminotransferase class IV n=1 Tax=Staphylococcus agnetis TaxID=985762 RepID=A0ABD7TTH2_9STAP|nr:aminotransferase class IV [Staphylococcus agnetis]UXU56902.1 aminotransferase class IV [Staphylococcus agnetis]
MELFETMRLEQGHILREAYHRNRIKQACTDLNFEFNEAAWSKCIHRFQEKFQVGTYRVKLIVDDKGRIHEAYAPLPDTTVMSARLKKVAHSTPMWQRIYKTTERDYLKHTHETQLILLYNDNEKILEFDIGNVVVEYEGLYYTPPYENDFLRGCMRQSLLEEGQITTKSLNIHSLKQFLHQGGKLWMINSLRGWVPVQLSDI